MWWFKRVNPIIKRIVFLKPNILNEYAKQYKLFKRTGSSEKTEYLKGKLDLIEELLDGKG